MKTLSALALFFILGLYSCSDKLRSLDDTAVEVSSVNGEEISFSKKITINGSDFAIAASGNGSIRYLDIRSSRKGVLTGKLNDEIEGVVYEVLKSDLNNNGKPEILLVIMKNEIESNSHIVGFEFDNKKFKRFELPDLTDDMTYGYKGKDHFYLSNSKLVHEFPIYSDSLINKSRGKRRLIYSLNKSLAFTLVKFEELK